MAAALDNRLATKMQELMTYYGIPSREQASKTVVNVYHTHNHHYREDSSSKPQSATQRVAEAAVTGVVSGVVDGAFNYLLGATRITTTPDAKKGPTSFTSQFSVFNLKAHEEELRRTDAILTEIQAAASRDNATVEATAATNILQIHKTIVEENCATAQALRQKIAPLFGAGVLMGLGSQLLQHNRTAQTIVKVAGLVSVTSGVATGLYRMWNANKLPEHYSSAIRDIAYPQRPATMANVQA